MNNRLPRCCFTIKGVRGCTNRPDVTRFQIHGDKSPPCPPSSNPSSSLKVKADLIIPQHLIW